MTSLGPTAPEAPTTMVAALGHLPATTETCDNCYGSGNLAFVADGLIFEMADTPCPDCHGTGQLPVDECEDDYWQEMINDARSGR